MAGTLASNIKILLGRQLSAVTFVQDYWQLAFDGPVLTVFSGIKIETLEETVSIDHSEFRNRLCMCIAKIVESAVFDDGINLSIFFDSGTRIEISVRDCDYVGPEVLIFDSDIKGAPLYVV